MSMFKPKMPAPPPVPEVPEEPDMAQAAALSEEAMTTERKRRKGRGSTIVAGLTGNSKATTTQKPTLLG